MRGIDVTLHVKTQIGVDGLNNPVYEHYNVVVSNVLVGQPSGSDPIGSTDLNGKRAEFVLGIPKGDDHDWEDAEVEFFGKKYKTFGPVIRGIEELVPTPWHKIIRVESYG